MSGKKWLVCLVLSLMLVLALSAVALAEEDAALEPEEQRAADALNSLQLFLGTGSGYDLENSLTREQAVAMVVRLLGAETEALEKNYPHPFTDVADWASPYVGYAYVNRITKGVTDTLFNAQGIVTEAEFLTFLLRVLGYVDQNDGSGDFVWDDPYTLAIQIGLIGEKGEGDFLRGDMVRLCWQALNTQMKDSEKTLADVLIEAGVFTKDEFDHAKNIITYGLAEAEKMLEEANSPDKGKTGSSGGNSKDDEEDEGGGSGTDIETGENETPPMEF